MADNADIIREYLVSLGFSIDQNSLNKMDGALAKTAKAVFAFAASLAATTTATVVFVDRVAEKMTSLYWASVKFRDGIASIQGFQLAIQNVGGTAEGVASALAALSDAFRYDPSTEARLRAFGIVTRDTKGNLLSMRQILENIAHAPINEMFKKQIAEQLGIDINTLQAVERETPEVAKAIAKMYEAAGVNADQAGRKSVEFENKMRLLRAEFDVAATILEVKLLPAVGWLIDKLTAGVNWLLKLDKATHGWSTTLFFAAAAALAVSSAVLAVGAALAITAPAVAAVGSAWVWVPALVVGLGFIISKVNSLTKALWLMVPAAVAIGLAFGFWPGLFVLVGLFASYALSHWKEVQAVIATGMVWLYQKYNSIAALYNKAAKFLHLPQLGLVDENVIKGYEALEHPAPDKAQKDNGLPDFQKLERGLGPWDLYGLPGGPQEQKPASGPAAPAQAQTPAPGPQAPHGKTPLGVRYNNPGNLQPGGVEQYFETPERGLEAMGRLLLKYSTKGLDTISKIISTYAPERDKFGRKINNTREYIDYVAKQLGLGKDQHLDLNSPGLLSQLMGAMIRMEQGYSPYSQSMIDKAAGKLAPSGLSSRNVTVNQKTDIKVSGTDAGSTARAVSREQSRINGDLVRNFAGATI